MNKKNQIFLIFVIFVLNIYQVNSIDCSGGTPVINLKGDACIAAGACPPNSLETTNSDSKTQCLCKKDTTNVLIKSDFSDCIATCPGGEAINLAGDTCIADTACPTNSKKDTNAASQAQCMCTKDTTNIYINKAKTDCTNACQAGEAINLAGDTCIADNACPTNSKKDTNAASQAQCMCTKDTTNIYRNKAKTDCVSTCQAGEAINLAGDTCIADTTCPTNSKKDTNAASQAQCLCTKDATNIYRNKAKTDCVSACQTGEAINLAADTCIADTACPTNSKKDTNASNQAQCLCKKDTTNIYRNKAKTDCTNACQAGEVINLVGDTCIADTTCPTNTEKKANTAGKQQCLCKTDFPIINQSKTDCTNSCGTNEQNSNNTCVCKPDFVKNKDGSSCVDKACNYAASLALNIAKTQCVDDSTTGCGGTGYISKTVGANKQCACDTNYFLNSDNTCTTKCKNNLYAESSTQTCVSTCSDTINLPGDTCIQASNCPSKSQAGMNSANKKQCLCNKDNINIYVNKNKDDCTNQCAGGEAVNIKGDGCIATADCIGDYEVQNGFCVCKNNKYLASDNQSCIDQCLLRNEVISLNSKKKSCILTNQCQSKNGIVRASSGNSNANLPSCFCSQTTPFKSSNEFNCVSECNTNEYKSLNLDKCQATDTTLCPQQITVSGSTTQYCSCKGGGDTKVVKVDRSGCINQADCKAGNQYTNPDSTKCFDNCQSELNEFSTNFNCKKFSTTGGSSLDGLCQLGTDTTNLRDGKNKECWCKQDTSGATPVNRYVSTGTTSCVTTCTVIDFNQRKCLAANPSTTTFTTDANNVLQCNTNYIKNIEGDSCMQSSDCSLINLQGDQCVTTCDQGVKNQAGTRCECPAGYFKYTDAKTYVTCVQQCPKDAKYINLLGKECTATCGTSENPNTPYNDKCVCQSGFYLKSTSCDACTSDQTSIQSSLVYVNQKGDKCLTKIQDSNFKCSDGSFPKNIYTGTAASTYIYQCQCKTNYYLNLAEDSCVLYCPDGQVYNKELKGCVLANCDLFQKSIFGDIDKTKCLLCAQGYGVQDGICVSNSNAGNVDKCRQYQLTSLVGVTPKTYKCLICYCDFALNNDGTQCVSNQVLGVQGCHQYDNFNQCKQCRATFFGDQRPANLPLNYNDNQNYEQNFLIVDLGMRTSTYLQIGFNKECVDNTDTGKVIACKEYSDATTCSLCHQDMKPFTVGSVNYCLKRKFYNPEFCKKFKYDDGTDGDTVPATTDSKKIDYKWCKCQTGYINYPYPLSPKSRISQMEVYFYYPYDQENFPNQQWAYNGCIKIITDCYLYDIQPWIDGTDVVTKCKKCLFGKILTFDRTQCVSSQSIYCTYAANPDTELTTINNCHASNTACQQGLNYITVRGIDDLTNLQCGSINYCQVQATTTSSTLISYTLDTCQTCFNYYTINDSKKYCIYYKQSTLGIGFTDSSNCNTKLGFKQTPNTTPKACQCDSQFQQLSYPASFPAITYTPTQSPTTTSGTSVNIPSYVRAPVNLGTCRNQPSANCADPYDADNSVDGYTGKCKRCISDTTKTWRSAAWYCLQTDSTDTIDNCEEIISSQGQIWCNQCSKTYGIIFGVKLQVSTTTPNFANNGQCTQTGEGPSMIKNCIKYDMNKDGTPIMDGTNLKCIKCRDGYKLDASTPKTCVQDEDLGCDYFYQFYTTDSTNGKSGNGLCECNQNKVVGYADFTYASANDVVPYRGAACFSTTPTNELKENCWLYVKTTSGVVNSIDKTKCAKCVTGAAPVSDACAISGVATSYDQCVTFYGRINFNDGTNPASISASDRIYDFQFVDTASKCKLYQDGQGVLFCGKYLDTQSCTQCKDGFQPYKNSQGLITQCVPKIKGCLIFNKVSAGGNDFFKCVRCLPSFTEIFISANTNDIKGIYCDDPSDQFVIIQESSTDTSIKYDQEPHPGCLKISSDLEVEHIKNNGGNYYPNYPIYEMTPIDYYTRNCQVCRDPYHLGFIGKKYINKNKEIADKIGCVLNNIEHCYSYETTQTKIVNGKTVSNPDFGKCNACYQPFRLWPNPADSVNYCILEGCKEAIIKDNKVVINQCKTCDNDTQDRPYYLINNVCKRHSLYIANCVKYSPTTDKTCITCDSNNEWYVTSDPKVCIQCKQVDKKYFKIEENGTACKDFDPTMFCGRQRQATSCESCIADNTFSSQSYPVYTKDTTSSRYIAKCIEAKFNCAEGQVIDATTYLCIRCFSKDINSANTYGYGFAQEANPTSCYNNDENQRYCYIYKTNTPTICVQCQQFVTNPNDDSSYYGLVFKDNVYQSCRKNEAEKAPFCNKWNQVLKAGSTTDYNYICQSCDSRYAQFIRDNQCMKGCKIAYAMKYCAQCHDGFTLVYKDSFSDSCVWNFDYDYEQYSTLAKPTSYKRIKFCSQYQQSIQMNNNTPNPSNDVQDQASSSTALICQKCKPGYVLVTQLGTVSVNLRCIKQYGSCKLDGCFILHDTFNAKKVNSNEQLYANAEMLRCDSSAFANGVVYSSTASTGSGVNLQNTIYSRNQYGCMMNQTDDATKTTKQYSFNKYTKKCDFYLYNEGDSIPSSPNDGSQANFGTTDLNSKGTEYDGGIAPPVQVTPISSSTSSSTTVPSTSTSSSSFGGVLIIQTLLLVMLFITIFV